MRLKFSSICLFTIIITLFVQEISAGLFPCGLFTPCTTTEPATPTESASASPKPSASSIVPPSSSAIPQPSPSPSSIIPSPKPSSVAPSVAPTSIAPSSSPTVLPSQSSSVSSTVTSPSSSPSPTPSAAAEQSGGSNIGVIVGSVCGFIAIIGAGFAYAFFSKTRKNNRNKRLYSNTSDDYHGNSSYQPDPFSHNSRPSPALAASAAVAADTIHGHNNHWDNNQGYNYGNMAPQSPMIAVAKQHDPYYNTGPTQMGYAVDPNINGYYNQPQQYYDPNAGYYEQQPYDQHYVDSQKQYVPQHHSPVINNNNVNLAPATTVSNVYSSPHSYPDDIPNPPHTPNATNGNSSTYR